MLYAVGAVAFALILVASVCLHEAGHMLTAKAFGMSVTRYFVGFGRTVFSFRRGETEYGLKAIPAGGFVTIVGMNPDDLEDGGAAQAQGRAFWQFPVWKRSIVLAAGRTSSGSDSGGWASHSWRRIHVGSRPIAAPHSSP